MVQAPRARRLPAVAAVTATVSAATLLAATVLAGCLPYRSAFLRLPVEVDRAAGGGPAAVRIPFATIRERMDDFDPADAAYYFRGREPLPHRYEDLDGDGRPDAVVLQLPAGAAEHWVVVVSPR